MKGLPAPVPADLGFQYRTRNCFGNRLTESFNAVLNPALKLESG